MAHNMSLSYSRQTSIVDQLVLVLQVLDQFEEFNLPWNEISQLRSDAFEFNVIALAYNLTCLAWPL